MFGNLDAGRSLTLGGRGGGGGGGGGGELFLVLYECYCSWLQNQVY